MASTQLTRSISSTGNRKTATFSAWVKKCDPTKDTQVLINFGGTYSIYLHQAGLRWNDGSGNFWYTNALQRDTNAWYHIVIAIDTTQATASDRVKGYINGVQETSLLNSSYPSQNADLNMNVASTTNYIGNDNSGTGYFDGIMSHVHWIDGTAYSASNFGSTDSTTGEWKINTSPSVTYGTNGFFILKDGNSVTDQSGNGNNFTVAGGTLTKSEDCPSNVFGVWNRLDTNSNATLSNGNTTFATSSNNSYEPGKCTLGFSSGKFYVEHKLTSTIGYALLMGIYKTNLNGQDQTSMDSGRYVYNLGNGSILSTSGGTLQSGLATLTNGDILGIAVDCDNGTIDFYKNGSQVGTTVTNSEISSNEWTFGSQPRLSTTVSSNFGNGYFGTTAVSSAGTNASGNGIFEYDVPTGFTALSTKGLNL